MAEPWYRDKAALEAAIALHGSLSAAARATGVSLSSLRKWRDPDRWRAMGRGYDVSEKGKARRRRVDVERRSRAAEAGMCSCCRSRKSSLGRSMCDRCFRYNAEYGWLGYSSIPLAKGSDG